MANTALTGLLVGGNAITYGFALTLGAGDRVLGLCGAIPAVMSLGQLLGAWAAPRLRSRRKATAWASTVARLLWLLPAGLALTASDQVTLTAFLLMWTVACGLGSFAVNLWVSWMADLVPAALRARYFARRTAVANLSGVVFGLAAGVVLDRHVGASLVPAGLHPQRGAFALLFGVAAAFGLGCFVLLRRQWEPPQRALVTASPPDLRSILLTPWWDAWHNHALRNLLLCVALLNLGNGVSTPFWTAFQLEQLHMDYAVVNGVLSLLGGVMTVVAVPLWGVLAHRTGPRNVVLFSLLIAASHPLYYFMATSTRHWPIFLDALSSGVAWSGYNLAIFNLVLLLAAGPRLGSQYAVYICVAGLSQALGSLVGGQVVAALPAQVHLLDVVLERRQLMFGVTTLARLGTAWLLWRRVPARTDRLSSLT